ncbi:MAG: hypothetical protein JSR65_12180 [Proteobacteria bacterium]|nr:hypothetical protein [Pseudomonadota bacterium]
MSLLVFAFWLLNISLDTGGHLAFKAAAMQPEAASEFARWQAMAGRPWIWIGVVAFIAEFVVWQGFLSLVPLSQGVLLGSIDIVAIMIAGRFLFAEKLTPPRVVGATLIAIGVAIVGAG